MSYRCLCSARMDLRTGIAPDAVGMRWGPDGARLALYRRRAVPCSGSVLAWLLA